MQKNREILRNIPGAVIHQDSKNLTKVEIRLNQRKINSVWFSAYMEANIIVTIITSNSVGGQPPLSYYWEALSREQQKYFAFRLDIFTSLK